MCNPQGIRNINNRYHITDRREISDERRIELRRNMNGRRNTDNRAWFEGTLEAAIELGWKVDEKIMSYVQIVLSSFRVRFYICFFDFDIIS